MEAVVNDYLMRELITQSGPLKHDTPLLKTGLLDSLSMLKLVLFLEEEFGIIVDPEDVIPEHFETVDTICAYLRTRQGVKAERS
jgi:acyl carrier protein